MPPIRQLDEAFLAHLLEENTDVADVVLQSNISSESLRTVLKKLTCTSNALQHQLFEKVHANFDQFVSAYNTSQELHENVFSLLGRYADVETQVSSAQQETYTAIDRYQHTLLLTQKNQAKIDTLERVQEIVEIVDAIDHELQQYLYVEAVQHINKLNTILNTWKEADTRMIGLVHDRLSRQKESIVFSLQDSLRTALHIESGSMRMLTTFCLSSNHVVQICHVFESLDQLGMLAEQFMGIQRSLFKHIILPYFEHTSKIKINKVDETLGKGGVLQVIQSSEEQTMVDPIRMLQQIDSILAFLYEHMFKGNKPEFQQLFSHLFMPDLARVMIDKSISPAIPSSKETLSDFSKVAQAVTQFEKQSRDTYGFEAEATLGTYVDNMDAHYAKKRREKILQEGRKVMVRRLYETDTTHGYQITQTPQILVVLVSDTIEEAADLLRSHPISATSLIEGIRDLLDMYRAIMPNYHRTQYASSPAHSLVFRNDCVWLAQQLTTMKTFGLDKLPDYLKTASERLKELGNAWHELAMMQRVQLIQTVLDHLDGFSGLADQKFQQDCDRAVTQVTELVNAYAAETRHVVDQTLFLDMLARIVESVLTRLIQDIEHLIDIGAEESHVLARILNSMAQLLNAFDLPGKDATETFVAELVPSWQKFWLVKDILEMNMREIMERYRRGNLHMFSKPELVGLLCALFADTELRESNIQEINA
ncbi:hypothetical protein CU098_002732, partial [Rhizopus stolonifer]